MFEFEPGVAVWTLAAFAIVYLIVSRTVFPVVRKTVQDRRAQIDSSLADASGRQEEARARSAELEERLRKLALQELSVLAEARDKAKLIYAEYEKKALEDFRRMRRQREDELAKMEEGAQQALRTAFARTVIAACHRVMRTELSPDQQSRIIDERLNELEKMREF
jgi:F0F1-type ATP synthase membrane subunit b/b'